MEAKLIKVVRQGLTRPNKYVELPPPRPGLRVVPDSDEPPDLADVQAPDLAEVQDEGNAVETDAVEGDNVKDTVAAVSQDATPQRDEVSDEERMNVVRYMEDELLPVLESLHEAKGIPLDAHTGITLARLIQGDDSIQEGHIALLIDRFTGDVPNWCYTVYDLDEIDNRPPTRTRCSLSRTAISSPTHTGTRPVRAQERRPRVGGG